MPTILRNVLYLSSVFLTSSLLALPEGELVVVGQAEFNSSEHNSLRITTSDKAIINYQKFNIAENEHVEFIQPSSKS